MNQAAADDEKLKKIFAAHPLSVELQIALDADSTIKVQFICWKLHQYYSQIKGCVNSHRPPTGYMYIFLGTYRSMCTGATKCSK